MTQRSHEIPKGRAGSSWSVLAWPGLAWRRRARHGSYGGASLDSVQLVGAGQSRSGMACLRPVVHGTSSHGRLGLARIGSLRLGAASHGQSRLARRGAAADRPGAVRRAMARQVRRGVAGFIPVRLRLVRWVWAGPVLTRPGRRGVVRPVLARLGSSSQGTARQSRRGTSALVAAWCGSQGEARPVVAGPGNARLGKAWQAKRGVISRRPSSRGAAGHGRHFKKLRPGVVSTGPWGESTINQGRG